MKQSEGKVTLVTGATRGIGKGIAIGLAEAGATVYITVAVLRNPRLEMVYQEALRKPLQQLSQQVGYVFLFK